MRQHQLCCCHPLNPRSGPETDQTHHHPRQPLAAPAAVAAVEEVVHLQLWECLLAVLLRVTGVTAADHPHCCPAAVRRLHPLPGHCLQRRHQLCRMMLTLLAMRPVVAAGALLLLLLLLLLAVVWQGALLPLLLRLLYCRWAPRLVILKLLPARTATRAAAEPGPGPAAAAPVPAVAAAAAQASLLLLLLLQALVKLDQALQATVG